MCVVTHAIICIFDFMKFMLFIIKFKKFELHNYGFHTVVHRLHQLT